MRCRFDLSVTFVWNINSRSWPSFFQRCFFSPFFFPSLSLSPRRSSGQLVFVDRPRRGENCLRIGCISLGFRGSCSPSSSAPLFFSSSLSPREEGSQRGRYKSDTPIQPSVFVSHITFFFAAYFFKLKILSFFSWMILANRFSRLIFFFFFFLNRNNLHPNSFRWQRLIGFFLNRSSFEFFIIIV